MLDYLVNRDDGAHKLRWRIDAVAAVIVFGALAAVLAFPEFLPRSLWSGQAASTSTSAPRTLAAAIEPSLVAACRDTFAQMQDPKRLRGYLSAIIGGRWRTPTTEEIDDARASLGSAADFSASCLSWGRAAIASCEKAGDVHPCIPLVQRALAVEPWRRCAAVANLPDTKVGCARVGESMQRWADRTLSAGL